MGKRKEEHEEHENHERWLVSYADMVTLLMVFFIVMFAMSQVDQKKFNALKAGLAAGFGQSTSVLDGSNSLLDQPGTNMAAPISPRMVYQELDQVEQNALNQALSKQAQLKHAQDQAAASNEVTRLKEVMDRVNKALLAKGLSDDVVAKIDERGLVLSLVSKHVIFEPNIATLSTRGRQIVDLLAPVLRDLPDKISIDGHTNQVPVKPKYYPSDWELSAARATGVLRYLSEVRGVPQARMSATAYGPEKPLMDPKLPGSQEVNKRVDIVVLTSIPEDAKALMDEALAEQAASEKPRATPTVTPDSPTESASTPPPASATESATPDPHAPQKTPEEKR